MDANELREEIGRALRAAWPGFAERHPQLAALLDAGTVLDAAADHFADNADYQHAMADASAREVSEQEMAALVAGLAKAWLHALV